MTNRNDILRAATAIAIVIGAVICAVNADAQGRPQGKDTLYHSDPQHLWNRLHHALFVRIDRDGTEYGFDELEPLLWSGSKYLLQGQAYEHATNVLDEFIATRGEKLIRDPVKRAMMQRDLWAVFDWAAITEGRTPEERQSRHQLQTRLAVIISRVALTKEQIQLLPDNYVKAAKSHRFANDFDAEKPDRPFLPADLFSTNADWVSVGVNGSESIAPLHREYFGGRSVFLVFMRTPGSRKDTIKYLETLRGFPQPWVYKIDTTVWSNSVTHQATSNQPTAELNPNLPQFPVGTTFALVRQAVLIDDTGQLVASPLTESVQIRRYLDVSRSAPQIDRRFTNSVAKPPTQAFYEFVLTREQLFNRPAASLRAIDRKEKQFMHFMSKGFDPFEQDEPVATHPPRGLACMTCHTPAGIRSVNSFIGLFQGRSLFLPPVADLSPEREREIALQWKTRQFDWGLLKGLTH